MHYLSVFDHKTNKRVAFLENAYRVGYTMEQNALWSAQFTLPLTDPKNRFCSCFNFVEIYDQDKYIGLFRILPVSTTKNQSTREVTYACEHVLATLLDDILFGWHEIGNRGVYTATVLRYILERQTVKRWQLGSCAFSHQYLYGWENENLLSALFSVPQPFTDAYRWAFDTTSTPWILSLEKAPAKAEAEIRFRKNMVGIVKTEDPSQICTRLYPLGYGEGVNQLNITSVNGGKPYIDADTSARHGIVSKVWVDQRYQDPKSLFDAATALLEKLKDPAIHYTVDALHNKQLLGRQVGDLVRVVDDEMGIDLYTRITAISKNDIIGAPLAATITLANQAGDIATSMADMNDRIRISETYAQGAVTLFTTHFYDNCAADFPAQLRFYIPENAVHINQILLNGNAAAFRGYTKATQGGGASASTTGSGGGSYSSTSSGGGTTTSSGGGQTSGGTSLTSSNILPNETTGQAVHNHGIAKSAALAIVNSELKVVGSVSWVPSGAHVHPEHSHTISKHTHTVSSHKHNVTIPTHEHSFSIPDHTHNITYGIYSGSTADSLVVSVDNTAVGTFQKSISDLNLVDYLAKDDSGNIRRGWHTIEIKPDKLSRVECDLVIQLFANSRGGGQF